MDFMYSTYSGFWDQACRREGPVSLPDDVTQHSCKKTHRTRNVTDLDETGHAEQNVTPRRYCCAHDVIRLGDDRRGARAEDAQDDSTCSLVSKKNETGM